MLLILFNQKVGQPLTPATTVPPATISNTYVPTVEAVGAYAPTAEAAGAFVLTVSTVNGTFGGGTG